METTETYLDKLNNQQRAAVEYITGPQLVIAGAGSGKTRVLTYKIVHLLHNGYEPWRILALTFTNKAANEMRQRIQSLVGEKTASKIWMGTFHSIFSRILRINAERIGYKSNFTIYDAADSKSLIKTIIKEMDLDEKIYKPSIVISAISSAKNALISAEKYATMRDIMEADKNARRPLIYAIYRRYRDRCFASGAMDFDDLLYYTNVLLRDNPDILCHYREYFRYVLVDEYQDTNFAQHVIVNQLCIDSGNLSVVGDDAQSIYSFRGANISNILNLKQSYPTLEIFKLEQNYRSTQNIINAANSLIEKNTCQIPKKVFSKNQLGDRITVVQSYSDFEEGYLVANKISQLKMKTHDSFEEFAILYRTNAQSRILEEALRKRNIPYRIYGGLSFYQRKEIKDAIAYFRMAVNPDDDEALRRIINFPTRGIGETTLNKILRKAIDNQVSMWNVIQNIETADIGLNSGTIKKINAFRSLIQSFNQLATENNNAETVATKIIDATGLISMLITENTPENLSKRENLNELLAGVQQFISSRTEEGNEHTSLTDYLGEISLATDQDSDDQGETTERVTLMTVHAAKGLEFNNVFIVGVEEDLFPSILSAGQLKEIEEERRLLYVAITRAKNYCTLSYASSRYRNGMTVTCNPSRFLRDINPQYLYLSSGATIYSKKSTDFDSYKKSYHSSSTIQPANTNNYRPSNSQSTTATTQAANLNGKLIHTPEELKIGMLITHDRFGEGTITNIDTSQSDARIQVDFLNTGSRLLLLKFARFTINS